MIKNAKQEHSAKNSRGESPNGKRNLNNKKKNLNNNLDKSNATSLEFKKLLPFSMHKLQELALVTLVTGNTGTVTFWEAQHAAVPTKCYAYHAMPSGGHSAQTVTVPPIFGQNPGNSKTDVCYLPSTHAMTNFPLSHSRLKKSWHSPLCPSNRHIVVGHDWPHIIVRPSFSHKKPNRCFQQ
jgi:hypothetical protein